MALLELNRRCRATCLALFGWLAFAVLAGSTPAQVAQGAAPAPPPASAAQEPWGLEPGRAAQIRQLIPDPANACLPAAGAAGDDAGAEPAIAEAARALRVSPVGAWLLDHAAAQGVLICLDPATPLAAWYRAGLHLIGVQAALPPAGKTLFLAHVPQHPSYSNNRSFPVDDLILMHRMREAAAEAIATRVLWQMQRRGRPEAWRAKLETGYGDIARVFAAAMAGSTGGPAEGAHELQATRAAFDQWFAWSLRLQQYDSHMLDHVERIAQDRLGLIPPRRKLTGRFLRDIALHAGETFLPAEAAGTLTGERYRAGLSSANAARLADILGEGAPGFAGAAAALPAVGKVPPRS